MSLTTHTHSSGLLDAHERPRRRDITFDERLVSVIERPPEIRRAAGLMEGAVMSKAPIGERVCGVISTPILGGAGVWRGWNYYVPKIQPPAGTIYGYLEVYIMIYLNFNCRDVRVEVMVMPRRSPAVVPHARALCTTIHNLMIHHGFTHRWIAEVFSLSPNTVRSLACGRRYPGPETLIRIGDGCLRLIREAETPDVRRLWDAVWGVALRCEVALIRRDLLEVLRATVRCDCEQHRAPAEFDSIHPEAWRGFGRDVQPDRALLEQIASAYRMEAHRAIQGDRPDDDAIYYRSVAVLAEMVRERAVAPAVMPGA